MRVHKIVLGQDPNKFTTSEGREHFQEIDNLKNVYGHSMRLRTENKDFGRKNNVNVLKPDGSQGDMLKQSDSSSKLHDGSHATNKQEFEKIVGNLKSTNIKMGFVKPSDQYNTQA